MASFVKFYCWGEDLHHGKHNLSSHQLKVLLSNTLPSLSNEVESDIVQITAGGGYSTGGLPLVVTYSAQAIGVYRCKIADYDITASGTMADWRYAIVCNSSSPSVPLIGYIDTGIVNTMTNGDKVTLNFDETNGLIVHENIN